MVNTTTFFTAVKTNIQALVLTKATHIAAGTGSTTPTPADTTLDTETLRNARQDDSTGTSDVVVSLFISSVQGNGTSLVEVGAFDDASSGDMMNRALITLVGKTASIEVWVDIEQQIDVTQ